MVIAKKHILKQKIGTNYFPLILLEKFNLEENKEKQKKVKKLQYFIDLFPPLRERQK